MKLIQITPPALQNHAHAPSACPVSVGVSELQENFTVEGLTVRTRNADEMQASTARIGPLWAQFGQQVGPRTAPGALLYGVYHRYESDASGAFDVLVGTQSSAHADLARAEVVAGTYLVFQAQGAMPQTVIQTWDYIWRYFASSQCPHRRLYGTDFECYRSLYSVEIFIGIVPAQA